MIVLYGYMIYWAVAAIGITYGYHRYFSHNDYKTNSLTEVVLLYLGLLCGGRSALTWAGVHRIHHAHADTEKDPHSPKNHPWYVILFSLWKVKQIPRKYMIDLIKNPRVMFFHTIIVALCAIRSPTDLCVGCAYFAMLFRMVMVFGFYADKKAIYIFFGGLEVFLNFIMLFATMGHK